MGPKDASRTPSAAARLEMKRMEALYKREHPIETIFVSFICPTIKFFGILALLTVGGIGLYYNPWMILILFIR
jgi:nitrate reductase NapE component